MDHEKYIELISAALDGELTAQERQELDGHLSRCPRCAALFGELSAQSAALRELDCPMPEGLYKDIMGGLPEQAAAPVPTRGKRWGRWAALAACVALVIFAGGTLAPRLGGRTGSDTSGNMAPPPALEGIAPRSAEGADIGGSDEAAPAEAPEYNAPAGEDEDMEKSYSTCSITDIPEVGPGAIAIPPEASEPMADGLGEPIPAPSDIPEALNTMTADPIAPAFEGFQNDQYLRVTYGLSPAPGAVVLGSADSLADYLTQFPADDLSALAETYREDFFQTARLLAVVVEEPSGSITHTVDQEGLRPLQRQVTVCRKVPEVGTDDMAAWLILAEVGEEFADGDILTVIFETAER